MVNVNKKNLTLDASGYYLSIPEMCMIGLNSTNY